MSAFMFLSGLESNIATVDLKEKENISMTDNTTFAVKIKLREMAIYAMSDSIT